MKITFLGTGTSTGIPEIGCTCKVCLSDNEHDKRLRTSVLINVDSQNILIDCGPDFRSQMLQQKFEPLNAILLTHEHYDHVAGIDDLRPFCRFGDIQIYAEQSVCSALNQRISYCFAQNKYPGVPNINLNPIDLHPFSIGKTLITPIRLMHLNLPILGFRINNFAYLTDLKWIPESEFAKLEGLEVLVMNALRIEKHLSHQNLQQALENAQKINPQKTYFTHISHHLGLHEQVEKILPNNVFLAYDQLTVDC